MSEAVPKVWQKRYCCSRCGLRSGNTMGFDIGFWHTKRGLICGMVIAYDRMRGSSYCYRKLKECKKEAPDA